MKGRLAWVGSGLGMVAVASLHAQVEREYFARTPPAPVFQNPDNPRYNLKLGKLTAHLSGNVQAEFNDNINLSDKDPQADFSLGPYVGVGFLWPVTRKNVIQVDIGVGYRWYLNNPDVSSINVAPNTHFDYTIHLGDVKLTFHDRFSIMVDPVTRGELSGGSSGSKVMAFRRLNNTCGVEAETQVTRDLTVYGGYDFTIDRTLTSEYASIDHDQHAWHAGFSYAVSPRIKTGVTGTFSIYDYLEDVQNDGYSFSIGPTVSVKLSKFITLTASAGWGESWYDHNGSIGDDSNFSGPSYHVSLQHVLNPRSSHNLRFGQSTSLGIGSNYSENMVVQYGLNTQLTRRINVNLILAYEHLTSSGRQADASSRYMLYLGSGYQFARAWSMGVSYSLAWKDSDRPDGDYVQNRLTLDLTRRF